MESPRDGRDAVVRLAVQPPRGANAPVHDARPRRVLVEGVVLALVRHVRARREPLAGVDEPDHVAARAGDGSPVQQSRVGGREGSGDCGPAHVEAERCAPGAGALSRDRAHVRVERVGVAGHPGERDGHGDGGALQAFRRPDHAAVGEALARGELELIGDRAGHRAPAERRCPGERVDDGLVGAQHEGVQARGRLGVSARLGSAAQHERGKQRSSTTDAGHRLESCRHRRVSRCPSNE